MYKESAGSIPFHRNCLCIEDDHFQVSSPVPSGKLELILPHSWIRFWDLCQFCAYLSAGLGFFISLFLNETQANVCISYKHFFAKKKNDFQWSWARENFVSLIKCLSLVLHLLGAYYKANQRGLLFYSRRQELAGLGSHCVCVMHSFCPTPCCRSAEVRLTSSPWLIKPFPMCYQLSCLNGGME